MSDVVISMYDLTGKFVQPWAEAGYQCYCIDLQHAPGETRSGNITFVGGDMREWRPARKIIDRIVFAASFSPCDDAACSGARWFRNKGLGAIARSIELFSLGIDWIEWLGCPGMAEHPRSTIGSYYRKADHKFDPYNYSALEPSDWYTKETWIWGFSDFVMPEPDYDRPRYERGLKAHMHKKRTGETLPQLSDYPDDRIHKAAPGPDRANFRSATPMGFARAVYIANAATRANNSRTLMHDPMLSKSTA